MEWVTFKTLMTTPEIWTAIAAISAAISAYAAMRVVYHSRMTKKEELNAKRPYFILEAPGIKQLSNSPPYRIQITMKNIGGHVASDFTCRILIIKRELDGKPDFEFNFSVANAIPPNTPTPWYYDSLQLPMKLEPHYVILSIKYNNPILDNSHAQIYFMKWDGVQKGVTHPDFVYMNKDEMTEATNYLKESFNEFSQEYSL